MSTNTIHFRSPASLVPPLRAGDGSMWRIVELGDIELNSDGSIARLNCVLAPAAPAPDPTPEELPEVQSDSIMHAAARLASTPPPTADNAARRRQYWKWRWGRGGPP